MDLYEYQARDLFEQYGVPVLKGIVADTPEAVRAAAEHGLDRVLVTCDEDNVASRRTIERGGGVYEDSRNGKRRYWITTA